MRVLLLVLAATICFSNANAGDIYSWEDSQGAHFVDDLSKVPPKYRKSAVRKSYTDSDKLQSHTQSSPNTVPERQISKSELPEIKEKSNDPDKEFNNRVELEMNRLKSEKDALRGSPFVDVDNSIDKQMEKLRNNPKQYFYDKGR